LDAAAGCRFSDITNPVFRQNVSSYGSPSYITRSGFFGPFALDSGGLFGEIAPSNRTQQMNAQPAPTASRQILWPSVITVISAAILIGAEVFGAAFAGGWALAILFGLDDTGAHILQAVL